MQKNIGYNFERPGLLRRARTRRQYYQGKTCREEKNTMEPLATLGDAVLDLVVINYHYKKGERDEGCLSQTKEADVKKSKTSAIAIKLGYEKFVRWGKGEEKDEIWNSGIDTFDTCIEALIGAVFLDSQKNNQNGIFEVEKMLKRLSFF